MKACLVVDDSEVIRKVARRILEGMHFMVIEAESGTKALEHCQKAMPDAILLDWNMPGMSGIEFIGAVRMQATNRPPLIFYCTTENDADDITKAFSAGADEYILKPYDTLSIQMKFSEAGLVELAM